MKYLLIAVRATALVFLGLLPREASSLEYEFLLFPELNLAVEDYENPRVDFNPGIDFFASVRYQDVSLIGEYFLDKKEAELERLLLGWDVSDFFSLWVGRHHNFTGYWNTEFHHGAFLETSITRPAITEFEDDDGILPIHATGIAGDLNLALDDGLIRVSSMLGLGPVYQNGQELAAFDILNPETNNHDGSFSVRFTYFPESYSANQVGASVGGSIIPSTVASVQKINQLYAGPFVNWYIGDVRLISELMYVFNRIHRPSDSFSADILTGYLQAEFAMDQNWTVYGRFEGTAGQKKNLSIIFPDYITDRQVIGVRLDVGSQNAIKLEIGRKRDTSGATGEARMQWSAVFP